jgi:hypothetical protein
MREAIYDPDAPVGTQSEIYVDPMSLESRVRKVQDCEPVLDGVKMARDMPTGQMYRHVGSIPLVIASQWTKECGAAPGTKEFSEYAKKKLMSSDWAYLRVRSF